MQCLHTYLRRNNGFFFTLYLEEKIIEVNKWRDTPTTVNQPHAQLRVSQNTLRMKSQHYLPWPAGIECIRQILIVSIGDNRYIAYSMRYQMCGIMVQTKEIVCSYKKNFVTLLSLPSSW